MRLELKVLNDITYMYIEYVISFLTIIPFQPHSMFQINHLQDIISLREIEA